MRLPGEEGVDAEAHDTGPGGTLGVELIELVDERLLEGVVGLALQCVKGDVVELGAVGHGDQPFARDVEGNRLIVDVDPAKLLAALVLQGGERAPFVNHQFVVQLRQYSTGG